MQKNDLTPRQSLQAMYTRRAQNRLFSTVRQIVEKNGGYREKDIFSRLHHIERTETWNDEHKVVTITGSGAYSDGHLDSFSVDLVTMNICG
ncbi:MAG: hypothetical protein IIX10_04525 [Clostridia bacterium]|nr:hypothetical protein [Clostridia bacterium]